MVHGPGIGSRLKVIPIGRLMYDSAKESTQGKARRPKTGRSPAGWFSLQKNGGL